MKLPSNRLPRKILFFGEVLWDLLETGPQPGGAPANAAVQAHGVGADVLLISAVGDDALGNEMLARLTAQKLSIQGVQVIPGSPTGTVEVMLTDKGTPSYNIRNDVAWDRIGVTPLLREAAASAGAICFGSLAQRSSLSLRSLHELLECVPDDCVRFFDVNIRRPFPDPSIIQASLAHTDILKLNNEELPLLADWLGLPKKENDFVNAARADFALRAVLLTKGAEGAVIYERGHQAAAVPAAPIEKIIDTVGAGDAFSAGFLSGVMQGRSYAEAAKIGSDLAARVCQVAGAWLK